MDEFWTLGDLLDYAKKLREGMLDQTEDGALKTLIQAFSNAYMKDSGDNSERMVESVKHQLEQLLK